MPANRNRVIVLPSLLSRWEKTSVSVASIKQRVEQRPDEAQDRPLIADPQLLDDHVLDDRPEPHELDAILGDPRQPDARPARRRRRREELRVRDLGAGTRSNIHVWKDPIPASRSRSGCVPTPAATARILRRRQGSTEGQSLSGSASATTRSGRRSASPAGLSDCSGSFLM